MQTVADVQTLQLLPHAVHEPDAKKAPGAQCVHVRVAVLSVPAVPDSATVHALQLVFPTAATPPVV